jgi:hypothetical protein
VQGRNFVKSLLALRSSVESGCNHEVVTWRLSVSEEVEYWQNKKISTFTTQWQNFKKIGVFESISIRNALGVEYDMKIKHSNSTWITTMETSYRLYWTLAKDLTYIGSNHSVMHGKSLIRSSPNFVYKNMSLASILTSKGYIKDPNDENFLNFYKRIGPFGSVDAWRIAPTAQLTSLFQSLTETLFVVLGTSHDAQLAFWPLYNSFSLYPLPAAWDPPSDPVGGNVMCGVDIVPTTVALSHFSSMGPCTTNFLGALLPSTQTMVKAIIAANLVEADQEKIEAVCARDSTHAHSCVKWFTKFSNFAATYFTPEDLKSLVDLAATAKVELRDNVEVSMFQYLNNTDLTEDTYYVSVVNMFSPSEPDFEFWAWIYLFDWVEGRRSVIRFEGDVGTVTTISKEDSAVQFYPDKHEIPVNVAYFYRSVITYFSGLMFVLSALVALYIFMNGCYTELFNIVSFNFVAGSVWLGRLFMLLRGAVAFILLSTAEMKLETVHDSLIYGFKCPNLSWFSTILAASEMTWLVYIIDDAASLFFKQYSQVMPFFLHFY